MNKPPYWPVRKTTEILASDERLLIHLQNLLCDGSHPHAHKGSWSLNGHPTVSSSHMQVWSLELCERIAAGVSACRSVTEVPNILLFLTFAGHPSWPPLCSTAKWKRRHGETTHRWRAPSCEATAFFFDYVCQVNVDRYCIRHFSATSTGV